MGGRLKTKHFEDFSETLTGTSKYDNKLYFNRKKKYLTKMQFYGHSISFLLDMPLFLISY